MDKRGDFCCARQLLASPYSDREPIAQPCAEEITGTYWTTPTKATMAGIHPLLMAVVIMMPNHRSWCLHSADVYEMDRKVRSVVIMEDMENTKKTGDYIEINRTA